MLKIIMNNANIREFIEQEKFGGYASDYFILNRDQNWFKSDFVHRVLENIDRVVMDGRMAVYNKKCRAGYSVDKLCGGTKSLLILYNVRDRIFYISMGDNCCDLLEEIVMDYEREGKDLVVICDYLNKFNFKHIKEIVYLNDNIRVTSKSEIIAKVLPLYEKEIELDWDAIEEEFYTDYGEEVPW